MVYFLPGYRSRGAGLVVGGLAGVSLFNGYGIHGAGCRVGVRQVLTARIAREVLGSAGGFGFAGIYSGGGVPGGFVGLGYFVNGSHYSDFLSCV